MQWCNTVSQPIFKLFIVVTFIYFSTECGTHKNAIYIIFFCFFNKQSTVMWYLLTHFCNYPLNCDFYIFLFLFPLFSFTQIYDALWPYLPQSSHGPLNNLVLFWCFYPEFCAGNFSSDLFFLVSCFCLTLFSRTNVFISWGTFMPISRCWHFKILAHLCIILVRHQIHVLNSIRCW